jgi:TPR repeat protein
MYFQGDGVAQDRALGAQWIRKAADQGTVPAQARRP